MPPCLSLVMGTGSQSYLHHGAKFSILRNQAATVAMDAGKSGGCTNDHMLASVLAATPAEYHWLAFAADTVTESG